MREAASNCAEPNCPESNMQNTLYGCRRIIKLCSHHTYMVAHSQAIILTFALEVPQHPPSFPGFSGEQNALGCELIACEADHRCIR